MRKGLYKWLLAVGVALGVASCDEQGIPDIDDLMSFSDDHKVMTLSARLLHNVGEYDLADSSQVVVKALQEVKLFSGQTRQESQPVVTGVTNVSREQVVKLKLRLLVLVDLSVPQSLVDEERKAVREIKTLFGEQNLFLAFMNGDNVSETYQATDYVINNYFVHQDPSFVYLYRSMLTKLSELQDKTTVLGGSRYRVPVVSLLCQFHRTQ